MLEVVEENDPGELREAPLPSRSAFVHGLVVVIAIGALLPSVLGLMGRWGWLLDLCNHFRFQCLLALGVTTVALLLLKSWRWGIVSLAGLVLNAAFVLPLYLGSPAPAGSGSPTLTVMLFNINTANRDHAGVLQEIEAKAPDLLFVQEVNREWLGVMETGLAEYDLVQAEPRSDNFGIACFVRRSSAWPMQVTGSRVYDPTLGIAQVPAIEVDLDYDGRPINVLSIHPLPPVSLAYARGRDATLEAAGKWSVEQTAPHVIVGDLNATPWSTAFRDLQSAGGLVNSQVGFGRSPTWPAGLGSLGMIPIDHLLHSDELTTVDRQIGNARGSDHRPLIVTLGWRNDADQAE